MDRIRVQRPSARLAVAVGFCVTAGLWLYAGGTFSSQMDEVRDNAAAVASRYDQAQQLLSTIRTQVLLMSVGVRDALLTRERPAIAEDREQIEEAYRVIMMALQDYEPVVRTADESEQILRLRLEFDRFHEASLNVLNQAAGGSPAQVRDALDRHLMPRREAALFVSDTIQSLNRQAFIAQQNEIAAIYQAAELKSRRQLGFALALSLVVLLLTNLRATRSSGPQRNP